MPDNEAHASESSRRSERGMSDNELYLISSEFSKFVFQHARYDISCIIVWVIYGLPTLHERQFHMRYECSEFGKHTIAGSGLAASGVNYVCWK